LWNGVTGGLKRPQGGGHRSEIVSRHPDGVKPLEVRKMIGESAARGGDDVAAARYIRGDERTTAILPLKELRSVSSSKTRERNIKSSMPAF
jgi:hypothetical protein